jgi:hypothetical protein
MISAPLPEDPRSLDPPRCKRCGQCCHYLRNGELVPCRFLIRLGSLTACRIYDHRLGQYIALGIRCVLRSPYNWPRCPFNLPEQEPLQWQKPLGAFCPCDT